MAAPRARVEGARQLRATLKKAGVQLSDLKAAHAQVAGLVAARARPDTPHRTGALAATLRSSGTSTAAVVRAGRASVPYARIVHFRYHPWITDAAEATQDTWENTYLSAIEKIISTVEGAPGP